MVSTSIAYVNQCGASPAEWEHFADTLALRADMLPVVSDLAVPLGQTKITGLDGKTPTVIENGKARGLAGWPARITTAAEVARWARDGRHGIGLIGRQVKAFDIDIDDETVAGAVRDMLELTLGVMPCRGRPGTGKKLLMFRLAEPMPKRVITTAHGIVELLGDRQQFLLVGQHKSGTRYTWEGGLPSDIPTLTREEVDAAWQALVETFGTAETKARAAYVMRSPVECDGVDRERDLVIEHWEGLHGEDPQGRIEGRCPFEGEHSPGGAEFAMYFPAAVKGQGHSGFKCLHAHCSERTVFDFLRAIGVEAEVTVDEFDAVPPQTVVTTAGVVVEVQPLPAFERDKKNGRAEATRNNLDTALLHPSVSGWRLRFDRFLGRVMLAPDSTEEWRALDDNDYTRIARHLESGELRFKHIPVELIRAAIDDVAERHSFDSAQVWLATQEWDGVERCETFLTDYLGVEDTPYARSVSLYIWTALAGRVIEPGIKADMVPVLVGDQGVGKSTTIAALSPDPGFFGELNLALKDAELVRSMRGKLVLELGELRGMRVKEIDDLKQFIACRRDEFRDLYKRHMTVYPRRSLFIGSTNNETFLVDDTGARRWLPVTVPTRTQGEVASQVKAVARDCGQLWAEGARVFAQGGIQWQDAENLAKHEHGKFTHVDVWFEIIERWLAEPEFDGGAPRGAAGVTANELLLSALDVAKGAITDAARRRVTAVLRQLGYSEGRLRTADGKRPRVFRKT